MLETSYVSKKTITDGLCINMTLLRWITTWFLYRPRTKNFGPSMRYRLCFNISLERYYLHSSEDLPKKKN